MRRITELLLSVNKYEVIGKKDRQQTSLDQTLSPLDDVKTNSGTG